MALCTVVTTFVACSNANATSKQVESTTASTTQVAVKETTTASVDEQTTTADASSTSATTVASSTSTTKKGETTKKTDKKSTTKKAVQSTTKKAEKVITLQKNGKAKSDAGKAVSIKTGAVSIVSAGDYIIKSETDDWHGQIIIKLPNTAKCSVRFENVNISYNKGNIIQIIDTSIKSKRSFLEAEASNTDANDDAIKEVADNDSAPNVSLSFPTGTKSTFTSSSNSYTGVIYNESKLTFKGNGTLNVKSTRNTDNCICSTKSVTFKNLTANLSTANNTVTEKISTNTGSAKGIFTYNKVIVESGKLNVKTNGDGIRCDKFYNVGGSVSVTSSACDAIDADDVIEITGGTTSCYATEKSAFKVRRINAKEIRNENGKPKDYFKITKGTVVGESKKMTAPSVSGQATILAKIKKKNQQGLPQETPSDAIANDDDSRLQKITLQNPNGSKLKVSSGQCTKILYSKSTLQKNAKYQAKSEYGNFESQKWANGVCSIKIRSTK